MTDEEKIILVDQQADFYLGLTQDYIENQWMAELLINPESGGVIKCNNYGRHDIYIKFIRGLHEGHCDDDREEIRTIAKNQWSIDVFVCHAFTCRACSYALFYKRYYNCCNIWTTNRLGFNYQNIMTIYNADAECLTRLLHERGHILKALIKEYNKRKIKGEK